MDLSEAFYYDESSPSCLRWKVDRYGGRYRAIKVVSAGDVAGSLCDGNEYYRVTFQCKQLKVHKIIAAILGIEVPKGYVIDHIDGNPSNNKVENFRVVLQKTNTRNQKMRTTNTSGVTGVYKRYKDGVHVAWAAQIAIDGGKKSRGFSLNKYPNAFELACACRDKFLKDNPDYAERHGT